MAFKRVPYQMLIKLDRAKTMMNVTNNPNNRINMFNDVIIGLQKRSLRWGTSAMTNTTLQQTQQNNSQENSTQLNIITDGLVYYIDTGDTRSYSETNVLADITPYFNTSKSTPYSTATIVNSPTTISDEYVGTYLTFNGNGQYIIGADVSASLNNSLNENITIETWIRTISNSEGVIVTEQGTIPDGTTLNQGWHYSQQEIIDGNFYSGIWGITPPVIDNRLNSTTGSPIRPYVWQQYTTSYNAENKTIYSYINGKLVASRSNINRTLPIQQNHKLYFHAIMAGDSTNIGDGTDLEGDWAVFRAYDRALTQAEISNNYIYEAITRFGHEYPPTDLSNGVSVDGLISTKQIANEIYGNGTYRVTTSSSYNGNSYGYYMFNKNINSNDYWHSTTDYNVSTGIYEGTNSFNGINGEWVQIQFPNTITLKEFIIHPRYSSPDRVRDRSPQKFRLLGSTNGTSWSTISSYTSLEWDPNINNGVKRFDLKENTNAYSYYTIVFEIIGNSTYPPGANISRNSVQICEWVLIGA